MTTEPRIPTRLGDGSFTEMTRSGIRADIVAGSEAAARRAKVPPLGDDEVDHLLEIYASPARFAGVDVGEEVVLSCDGTGMKTHATRIQDLQSYEQWMGADLLELCVGDYSLKVVRTILAYEAQYMHDAQLCTIAPLQYGVMPNLGLYSKPDGPCENWSALLPLGRIAEARAAAEEAVEMAVADMVKLADSQWEAAWAGPLRDRLEPGMVLTADRGFFSYALWRKASAGSADLLWRIRTDSSGPTPVHVEDLPDGSWLADLRQRHSAAARAAEPMRVRIIDYTLDDGRENATSYRLFTTVLDPSQASATDLAAAYAQRWEIESTFDELKTHQRGPRAVLRSKSPNLVQQEIWGHLCCHYAIRALMADTAAHTGRDPDRISFVAALRITRRSLSHSSFPPS